MNQKQFKGILRHVLGAAGAFAVAKGMADESLVGEVTGALATLGALVWSLVEKANRR